MSGATTNKRKAEEVAEGEKKQKVDVGASVVKQMSFYFSDSNLPFDRFLTAQTQANEEGWVPLAVFMKFNKIKEFVGDDESALLSALKDKESDLFAISEDGKSIRRKTPIPENVKELVFGRSITIRGCADGIKNDDVETFFAEHGTVLAVRWHKIHKEWYVEFDTAETAQAVVAKTDLKMGENALSITMRKLPHKRKNKDTKKSGESKEADADADAAKKVEYTPGVVAYISNVGDVAGHALKDAFKEHGIKVGYAADPVDGKAIVRFWNEHPVEEVIKTFKEKDIKIGGETPVFEPISGEDEKAYYVTANADRLARQKNKKSNKRSRR